MDDESSEEMSRVELYFELVAAAPLMWMLMLIVTPSLAVAWLGVAAILAAVIVYPHELYTGAIDAVQGFLDVLAWADIDLVRVVGAGHQHARVITFGVLTVVFVVLIGPAFLVWVDSDPGGVGDDDF